MVYKVGKTSIGKLIAVRYFDPGRDIHLTSFDRVKAKAQIERGVIFCYIALFRLFRLQLIYLIGVSAVIQYLVQVRNTLVSHFHSATSIDSLLIIRCVIDCHLS